MKTASVLFCLFAIWCVAAPSKVSGQRDYFTPEEVELIRDAQQIDQRVDVLTHAIDRRFTALKIDSGGTKILPRDADAWGAMPAGTRFELLTDIKRILQKAIDDIDNLSERPESAYIPFEAPKHPKTPAELFSAAVHDLAGAAKRYQPLLKAELEASKAEDEKGAIMDSLDSCEEIIAAVAKLPAGAPKPAGKRTDCHG